jgi:hypothetical protein
MHERDEKCMQLLVGTRERKIPFGRSRRRWEDYIKTALKEMECDDVK